MKIREVTSGLSFPEGPIALDDGSVLLVEIASGFLTRITRSGRIQRLLHLGGGPNGAALGPDGAVYVCNNGGMDFSFSPDGVTRRPGGQPRSYSGGRLERVDLARLRVEPLIEKIGDRKLRGPNDLVFDAKGGIYFSDLGKVRPNEIDRGGLYYAPPGYSSASPVAYPIVTPNGVGLSPDGSTLYYAETEGARLWAFDIKSAGRIKPEPWPSPQGARLLIAAPANKYQRFDSLTLDSAGNIYVATLFHGGITIVSPDGAHWHHFPLPDVYPTNACFGGKGMRTLYVTLSGIGKLIAIDGWPIPGLKLHFT
ncbi:MAG: SMP-30/gluconolactonase/LRE family protein [Burkholderiaceae bacterium]|jgi:gluconolactonase